MKKSGLLLPSLALAGLCACNGGKEAPQLTLSGLDPQKFVAEYDGDSTALYTLKNDKGMEVCITNFGGRIVSIMVPDREGNMKDVVLGFDSIQAYFPEINGSDFGAAIGRYANRINQGRFVLDGDTMKLPQNNYGHCLHGGTDMGTKGWQYRVYSATQPNDTTLELSIVSPDGDNGFPGTVNATVTYTLKADNALAIAYRATTDKKTVINLTNHSYFNLSGNPEKPITDEILWVNADAFTPVDSTFMTTGDIVTVENTPMDFRTAKAIGRDIEADYIQVRNGKGYDHNWVIDGWDGTLRHFATLKAGSGRVMKCYTTLPGVQFYAGNFIDDQTGKNGASYGFRSGMCLETQYFPDSIHHPEFRQPVFEAGQPYHSVTIYKFR